MGLEAQCKATHAGQTSDGKAMLETDFVLFRGDFRVKIPFKAIRSVKATAADLEIDSEAGDLRLALGAASSKWADKILNPKSRADKLGVKPGLKVQLIDIDDESFLEELRAKEATFTKAKTGVDIVFLGVTSQRELNRMRTLRPAIQPAGAIWVVYPKGKKEFTENDVLAGGREFGFVDVKVAAFSATHTALKFVIPSAARVRA